VAYRDPKFSGGGHVDVIDAHGAAGDHAKTWTGLQQRSVDGVGEQAQDPVTVQESFPKRTRGGGAGLPPDLDLGAIL
jgi:hypothetical protein